MATEDGRFVVTPAVDGTRLDPRAIRAVLAPALATPDPADVALSLSTDGRPAAVSTEAAQAAADAASAMAGAALSLTLPDDEEPLALSPAQLASLIRFGTAGDTYAATVDTTAAQALIASLAEQVERSGEEQRHEHARGLVGFSIGEEDRVLGLVDD